MQVQTGIELLYPLSWQELSVRLIVALAVGAVIGFERELREKAAGLRTHMLVSFGSAIFTLVPIQLGMAQQSVDSFSRVLQGIVTGVGFVGGGVILHRPGSTNLERVKGLTTAMALWVACGLGIAAGCGLWIMGLLGALLTLLTLRVLKKLERI